MDQIPGPGKKSAVVNLSSTDLNSNQLSVLELGLSFVPTPSVSPFELFLDLQKFLRDVRRKEYFMKNDSSQNFTTNNTFKIKSNFYPPKNRNHSVETYCRLVELEFENHIKKKTFSPHNLTKNQQEALSELESNRSIVIKAADKGGAIVIMDKCNYDNEVLKQLENTMFYQKLKCDPTKEYLKELRILLEEGFLNGDISPKEKRFLLNEFPLKAFLYILPKIHKNPLQPPGRPIVSGIGSLTERISSFVDYHIKDFLPTLKSFIKDSSQFLIFLKELPPMDPDVVMCTLDIESLYTNIDHQQGLDTLEHFLNTRPIRTPSTTFLVDLASFVLKRNYFFFNDTPYLQISGTAMGTKMAPSFACLFVGHLEDQLLYEPQKNPFFPFIISWKRYIDDVFLLWKGPIPTLFEFLQFLNDNFAGLKFTLNYSLEVINFLDVKVTKNDHVLSSSLYTKPTDRNTLLHAESFHPMSLKKSLPVSQLTRLKRICDVPEQYEKSKEDMLSKFRERNYQEDWLVCAKRKVDSKSRDTYLQVKKSPKSKPNLIYYTTFTPKNKEHQGYNFKALAYS